MSVTPVWQMGGEVSWGCGCGWRRDGQFKSKYHGWKWDKQPIAGCDYNKHRGINTIFASLLFFSFSLTYTETSGFVTPLPKKHQHTFKHKYWRVCWHGVRGSGVEGWRLLITFERTIISPGMMNKQPITSPFPHIFNKKEEKSKAPKVHIVL